MTGSDPCAESSRSIPVCGSAHRDVLFADPLRGQVPDPAQPEARPNTLFPITSLKNTFYQSCSAALLEQHWQSWRQDVADLAVLLSIFAPQPLPWIVVELASDILGWPVADVDDARVCLYTQGLLQLTDDGCYALAPDMYPLLQSRLAQMPHASQLQAAVAAAIAHLAQQLVCDPLAPEVLEAMPYLIAHIATTLETLAQFMPQDRYNGCCMALSR
jgi:hypothetical protein